MEAPVRVAGKRVNHLDGGGLRSGLIQRSWRDDGGHHGVRVGIESPHAKLFSEGGPHLGIGTTLTHAVDDFRPWLNDVAAV